MHGRARGLRCPLVPPARLCPTGPGPRARAGVSSSPQENLGPEAAAQAVNVVLVLEQEEGLQSFPGPPSPTRVVSGNLPPAPGPSFPPLGRGQGRGQKLCPSLLLSAKRRQMGGAGHRQGGTRWEPWELAGTAPRCSVPAFEEVRLPHSEAWTSAC